MRRLKQTLLAGGVVYPAGTREDAIEVAVQREDVWDDTDIDLPEVESEDEGDDHPVTSELREFVQFLAERHLEDKDAPVSDLVASAVEEFGFDLSADDEPDGSEAPAGDDEGGTEGEESEGDDETGAVPPAPVAPAYAEQSLADLRGVAESRGLEFKGSGSNGNIVKADHDALVAALEADDAAKA